MKTSDKSSKKSANRSHKTSQRQSSTTKSRLMTGLQTHVRTYLARRPHRSFRRTRRRDYVRSLELPGYVAFTAEVFLLLRQHWKSFATLIIVFSVATGLLAGLGSQATYQQLSNVLNQTSENIFDGAWGEVGKASLLVVTSLNGTFRSDMSEAQQVYAMLLVLFTWLTTVWFLRTALASSAQPPKIRTAIYSSGAPLVSTALVAVVILLQLIPAALGLIAYSTALSTGFLSNPLISIVFFFVILGLLLLSVYLVISTFFALIVVTLPGMYPWQAIRTAGDMVVGRRMRLLLRLVWLSVVTGVLTFIIMVPLIIMVNWLQETVKQLAWIPIIPLLLTLVSTSIVVFVSSYVYILYRKVLDDDAAPA